MRAVAAGRLAVDSHSFERHIDRCLGCRACESVCPAGVEYGELLEVSRADLHAQRAMVGFGYRVLRLILKYVWLHPRRLRMLFFLTRLFRDSKLPVLLRQTGLTRLLPGRTRFALALLESSAGQQNANQFLEISLQPDRSAMLFAGCVGEGLFRRVNEATKRVLKAQGYEVEVPSQQVCCGALHAHAGDLYGARELARRNLRAFESDGEMAVVTNAGGCGAMLKSYAHLLNDDPAFRDAARAFSERVRDVGQVVSASPETGAGVDGDLVTYDASCHLMYGQHASSESLEMLRAVADVNHVPLPGSERCCGGAGIYNLMEPDLSQKVLAEKIGSIRATGASVVATGNPGCQMQIGAGAKFAGLNIRVCHPVELLDEWYRRSGKYGLEG